MAISRSRCVPVDQRIDQIITEVETIVAGTPYTAGDAIDVTQLAAQVIQVKYDNTTVSLNGSGELQAVTASALTEGCGIDITAGVVSASIDGTTIFCAGGNLSSWQPGNGLETSSQTLLVKPHTYIDVTVDGVAVDFTEVASYNGATDQYLRNNAGTFQWATLPPDTNTTYTAGAGINLSSTKFIADPHDASHVGLVDPTTGDDSSADDAQIGILWHEIANYDSAKNMLIGHAAGDTTKPVIEYKTVVDWLETLPDWSNSTPLVLISDGGADGNEIRWATISEMLSLLTGYTLANEQSIGKDAGTGPEWQDDTDACP